MSRKRCFVLGLDGMPYSLVESLFKRGKLKKFKKIAEKSSLKPIKSVYPTVSSVAWTCYATGKPPEETNIFGFTEAKPETKTIYIPVDTHRRVDNIWEKLSDHGKHVIVMNVPISYPVKEVNGILVSSFLAPSLEKATYPYEFYKQLKTYEYELDADASLAVCEREKLMKQLLAIMEARFKVCLDLLKEEEWDYFQLNIMETDRMFHFFWDEVQQAGDEAFHTSVDLFFERLDDYIQQVYDVLDEETAFLVVSDHGFEAVEKEVFLNTWLEQKGYLKFTDSKDKNFFTIAQDSVCYSLAPGRVYFLTEHRTEEMIRTVQEQLLKLNEEAGALLVKDAVRKEDFFQGTYCSHAPDLLIIPGDGYDFKGEFGSQEVLKKRHFTGMHTYEDAVIMGSRINIEQIETICDVSEVILKEMLYEPISVYS